MQVVSLPNIWECEDDKTLLHVTRAIFSLKLLSGYFSSIKRANEGTWLKVIMRTGFTKDWRVADII